MGRQPAGRFDVLGFLTVSVGLFALLLALSEGRSSGWTSYPVLILLTVGVLSLGLFVVVELEVDAPLLDVRVFRSWPSTNSLLLISVLSVGLFAVLFYVPLYLQQALGLGAFEAGVVLLPQALVMAVLMPVARRLYDRVGARWPAVVGLVIVTIGTWLLHDLTVSTSHAVIIGLLAFRAAGMGLAMMPVMTGGIAALPPAQVGAGSAFDNVVQRAAAALGLAVLSAFLSDLQAQQLADRSDLVTAGTPIPSVGAGPMGETIGTVLAYQQTSTLVFVSALDDLMIVTTWISLVAVGLALLLRSRPATATGADTASRHLPE